MDVVLGIGSVVWRHNESIRVYDYPRGHRIAGPQRRPQWVEWEIRGETSRSWVAAPKGLNAAMLERLGKKIPKRATPEQARQLGFALTEQAVDDDVWAHTHRHRVVRAVEAVDLATLRKVAELVGYDDKAER